MNVLFKARRQWVALVQHDGLAADITITRHDWTATSRDFGWWVEVSNPVDGMTLRSECHATVARSLLEAKRRAAQHAKELIARVIAARGGA